MDVQKQISYWRESAIEDLAVANELLDKERIRYALFFAHLCVEKMLKALVCKHTRDLAPKMHNLVRLAGAANISMDESAQDFLAELNAYNIEGRYPEGLTPPPTRDEAAAMLQRTSEFMEWLQPQL